MSSFKTKSPNCVSKVFWWSIPIFGCLVLQYRWFEHLFGSRFVYLDFLKFKFVFFWCFIIQISSTSWCCWKYCLSFLNLKTIDFVISFMQSLWKILKKKMYRIEDLPFQSSIKWKLIFENDSIERFQKVFHMLDYSKKLVKNKNKTNFFLFSISYFWPFLVGIFGCRRNELL